MYRNILSGRLKKLLLVLAIVIYNISPIVATEAPVDSPVKNKQLEKKMDWLRVHGEDIWVGRELNKIQIRTCRQNEYNLLYLRDWGIARLHYTKPLVHCPQFFYQINTETQDQN